MHVLVSLPDGDKRAHSILCLLYLIANGDLKCANWASGADQREQKQRKMTSSWRVVQHGKSFGFGVAALRRHPAVSSIIWCFESEKEAGVRVSRVSFIGFITEAVQLELRCVVKFLPFLPLNANSAACVLSS
jgi:hypothetical protein